MNEAVTTIVTAVVTAAVTWFFSRRKNNAEAKLAELDAAKASVAFYENLLDNAAKRLNEQVALNDKQSQEVNKLLQALRERDDKIRERDAKIDLLLGEIEQLTSELKKYKQLNGKLA